MIIKTYKDRKGPLEFKIPLTKIKNPTRPKIKYRKIRKNLLKYSISKDMLWQRKIIKGIIVKENPAIMKDHLRLL
jgi:hypothetical protein